VDPLLDRALLLGAVVVVVLVSGALWRVLDTRRRRHAFDSLPAPATTGADLLVVDGQRPPGLGDLGSRATFVVVGTRGCSDCARTLAQLRSGLAGSDGVAVHHVLAERAPELVDRFHVRTAPTVLLAGPTGHVVGVHRGPVDLDVATAALGDVAQGRAPFEAVTR
jgi:hypothetical protein